MTKHELQELKDGLRSLLVRVQAMESHCKELSDLLLHRMDYTNDLEEKEWNRQEAEWEREDRKYRAKVNEMQEMANFKGWTHV